MTNYLLDTVSVILLLSRLYSKAFQDYIPDSETGLWSALKETRALKISVLLVSPESKFPGTFRFSCEISKSTANSCDNTNLYQISDSENLEQSRKIQTEAYLRKHYN